MSKIKSPEKVAVLAGGISSERSISIQSGKNVAEALKKSGFETIISDISPDNLEILNNETIDVFFIALHGKFGEDGELQKILEDKKLIYTGSGSKASRLCFDKIATKNALAKAGINTPEAIEFDPAENIKELEKKLSKFGGKCVIKPLKQGSSVGISIENDLQKAITAAKKCYSEFGDCMLEKFVSGKEITVGILDQKPLPIIEIKTKTNFYDYHAKYVDEQTEFLFDTISDAKLVEKIQKTAVDCFNTLGCSNFARVDFILNDGIIYALEINTIPGFTSHSLLPLAAAKDGISMSELCRKIVEAAYKRKSKVIN
ncbi:MAG: D-alanine--D-alanine ligase [Planctomycetes bacterium]|nr:D-alanine--D-alanine ligase [Planctomycetota bacterium]